MDDKGGTTKKAWPSILAKKTPPVVPDLAGDWTPPSRQAVFILPNWRAFDVVFWYSIGALPKGMARRVLTAALGNAGLAFSDGRYLVACVHAAQRTRVQESRAKAQVRRSPSAMMVCGSQAEEECVETSHPLPIGDTGGNYAESALNSSYRSSASSFGSGKNEVLSEGRKENLCQDGGCP